MSVVQNSKFTNDNSNGSSNDFQNGGTAKAVNEPLVESTFDTTDRFNHSRDNENTCRREIPEGYQVLPEEFFQFKGILPPLVAKSWLQLVRDDSIGNAISNENSDEEDSLPLSWLREKLGRYSTRVSNGEVATNDKNPTENVTGRKKMKRLGKGNENVICRKRGRPRKNDSKVLENEACELSRENFRTCSEDGWDAVRYSSVENVDSPEIKSGENVEVPDSDDCSKEMDGASGCTRERSERTEKDEEKGHRESFPGLECGKSFTAVTAFENHKRLHGGTLVKCPECSKGFTTKYFLKCHMRIHTGDLFACTECDKGFITPELLKVHMRSHTGDRPFICNICERSFQRANNLAQHKQIHNSEKTFLCFKCGSSFTQKRLLKSHMLTHSEKSHACTVCGKLWSRKSDLVEHMRVHTGQKPYRCGQCPQSFSQLSSLKRHKIVHTSVSPVQCPTCHKMFKYQEYYKRHLKKHKDNPLWVNYRYNE